MKTGETTSADSLDKIWSESWKDSDIINKIRSVRNDENLRWKLKYAPNHGKFLEAGCGLGQYVFHFKSMGFDIQGVDISRDAIDRCSALGEKLGFDNNLFSVGDVRNLNFPDNHFSYYLCTILA